VSFASRISSTSSVVFAFALSLCTVASSLVILSLRVGMSSGKASRYLLSKYDYLALGSSVNTMLPLFPGLY
jgi:hypothetical protein